MLNERDRARYEYFGSHCLTTSGTSTCSALCETVPFYSLDYSLIEELDRSALNKLFNSKKLPRLELVQVNEPMKDELARGSWLKGLNTLKFTLDAPYHRASRFEHTAGKLPDSPVPHLRHRTSGPRVSASVSVQNLHCKFGLCSRRLFTNLALGNCLLG